MNLEFKTNKLKKQCENPKEAQKTYGEKMGNKLTQRVNELRSAINLDDVSKNKANGFHPLDGDRKGEFAVILVQPHRLIFKPVFENSEETSDLSAINIVKIEEVIDYHGKSKRK